MTLKEVKMKTKIMLTAAVVLAVALVGTARPAVGVVNRSAEPTALKTLATNPGSYDMAPSAAETQEKLAEKTDTQEKEKEKAKVVEKEKPAVEKKVVVKAKEGEKTLIEITITEGNEVKTLTLDKPLTITTAKEGHALILSSEGKEIQVLKGEPLLLEIKGGGLEVIKEDKALKIAEGGVYKVIKEADKEGAKVVLHVKPDSVVVAKPKLDIIKEGKYEKGGAHIVIETAKKERPTIAWTIKESGKKGDVWIAKEFSGKPFVGTWISEDGKTRIVTEARDKELLEKVREIREQVAAIKEKKSDFSSLEKSLEKLEAMLKPSEEKLSKIEIKVGKEPGIAAEDATTIQLVATGKAGEEGRKAYERAVAKLKEDLPDGYKLLEQNYDEESGAMTFKISSPEGKVGNESLIKKLVESLKAEVKK
jgi:hypothetical protein